jgi:predicted nucleic acid-binding protein
MSEPKPLFVDTNAFVAIFDEDDSHHERANNVLDAIQGRTPPYGPLFTIRSMLHVRENDN